MRFVSVLLAVLLCAGSLPAQVFAGNVLLFNGETRTLNGMTFGGSTSVPGVDQGYEGTFMKTADAATIYIDPERIEDHSVANVNSEILLAGREYLRNGLSVSDGSIPEGEDFVYLDGEAAVRDGRLVKGAYNSFGGDLFRFTYKGAATLKDGSEADVVITYSDLTVVLQNDLPDLSNIGKLYLACGELVRTGSDKGSSAEGTRYGLSMDVNIHVEQDGKVVSGTFYFPIVDIDVIRTGGGFGKLHGASDNYNWSEQISIRTSGVSSGIYIPGAYREGAEKGYTCLVSDESDSILFRPTISDNNSYYSGFVADINNRKGLDLRIWSNGSRDSVVRTYLFSGDIVWHRITSRTSPGGTIQTTYHGNDNGLLDDEGALIGPSRSGANCTVSVPNGKSMTYTMKPDTAEGYRLGAVMIDGKPLDGYYTDPHGSVAYPWENGSAALDPDDYNFKTLYDEGGDPMYTVTFAADDFADHTIEVWWIALTEFSGKKIWDDYGDAEGVRPRSVSFTLEGFGSSHDMPVSRGADVVWSGSSWDSGEWTSPQEAEGWFRLADRRDPDSFSFVITDLPRYFNVYDDQEINYALREDAIPNYSVSYGAEYTQLGLSATVTNRYKPGYFSPSIHKIWNDGSDRDRLRPETLRYEILNNAGETVRRGRLKASEGWYKQLDDLPMYTLSGDPEVYTFRELPDDDTAREYTPSPANGEAVFGIDTDGGNYAEITNEHVPEKTEITVEKVWTGGPSDKPEITLRLRADGRELRRAVIRSGEASAVFEDLYVYENGRKIVYSLTEDAVEDYVSSVKESGESGFTVTNSYSPGIVSVSVTKVWDDDHDRDGMRPENVVVTLLAGGKGYLQAELDADNGWAYTWTDVPLYTASNAAISYSLEEAFTEGYSSELSGSLEQGFTVTNTHVPETVDITAVKIWDDADDRDGLRPASGIYLQLFEHSGGEKKPVRSQLLDAGSGSTAAFTWTGLPRYRDGEEIVYSVDEYSVPIGYEKTVSGDAAEGFTVTNRHIPDEQPPEPVYSSYRIVFDANGGEGEMGEMTLHYGCGDMQKLLTNRYKKNGCSFAGWEAVIDGETMEFSNRELVWDLTDADGGVIVMKAVWERASSGGSAGGGSGSSGGSGSGGGPAPSPVFSTEEHWAYIIGYPVDFETGLPTEDRSRWPVYPERNISRAEVATVFFRMLTDEVRKDNWTTENGFSDVDPGAWYNNAISVMARLGVVGGYGDGTFRPDGSITRAEMASWASRFARLQGSEKTASVSFSDISGHWASEDILYAASVGWVSGYPDGTYRPDAKISRAEFMTMVNRVLEREPKDEGDLLPGMIIWPDNSDSSAWYYLAVQEATNSHSYTRKTEQVPGRGFRYESWVRILPARDWSLLEKTWSYADQPR